MRVGQFRNAMAAGVAFVALFLAGAWLTIAAGPSSVKGLSSSALGQHWVAQLSHSGNRVAFALGAVLLTLSAIALVWFAAGLAERLLPFGLLEGRLVFGFGILAAAGVSAAAVGGATIVGGNVFSDEALPISGDAVRLVAELFFPCIMIWFSFASAGLIAATTIAISRTQILPLWFRTFGGVAFAFALIGYYFFPVFVVLLWYVVVAAFGIARAPDADEALVSAAPASSAASAVP